ncbi:VOC family protein [Streptacidiphilus sp. EB129]|uniref:VOC family protein n=1 Tax=Streptacidiphilus sp. EB129 TaxID=3156262 RepID=UPI0035148927
MSGSVLLLSDPDPDGPFSTPGEDGPAVALHVFVPDVDALTTRAVAAGAELLLAAADMPYGARQSTLRDPFGHIWILLTWLAD